jgi:hypothetical protein
MERSGSVRDAVVRFCDCFSRADLEAGVVARSYGST